MPADVVMSVNGMRGTITVGGATSGYSETGNWKSEIPPNTRMRSESVPAKTGRVIK